MPMFLIKTTEVEDWEIDYEVTAKTRQEAVAKLKAYVQDSKSRNDLEQVHAKPLGERRLKAVVAVKRRDDR